MLTILEVVCSPTRSSEFLPTRSSDAHQLGVVMLTN